MFVKITPNNSYLSIVSICFLVQVLFVKKQFYTECYCICFLLNSVGWVGPFPSK